MPDDALPLDLFTATSFEGEAYFEPVRVGPASDLAVLAPSSLTTQWRQAIGDGDVAVKVKLDLALVDGFAGNYRVTAFLTSDPRNADLTADAVRRLPLADMFRRALERSPDLVEPSEAWTAPTRGRIVRLGGPNRDRILVGPDVVPTDEERTLVTFTLAKLAGQDTNRAVADLLDVTPAAAAQRIRRLRRAHRLPPASGQGSRRS